MSVKSWKESQRYLLFRKRSLQVILHLVVIRIDRLNIKLKYKIYFFLQPIGISRLLNFFFNAYLTSIEQYKACRGDQNMDQAIVLDTTLRQSVQHHKVLHQIIVYIVKYVM